MAFAAAALDPALVEPLGLVAKTLAAGAIVDALVAAVSPPPLPLAGVPVSLSAPDEYSALAVAVAFVAAVASARVGSKRVHMAGSLSPPADAPL